MPPVDFDLLIKYLSGHATPEEAMELELWRSSSTANFEFLEELSEAWYQNNEKPYKKADVEKMWAAFSSDQKVLPLSTNSSGRTVKPLYLAKVAALVFVCLGAGLLYFYVGKHKDKNEEIIYTTSANGNPGLYMLPDSSSIKLERGTARYPGGNESIRNIILEGKALFTVKHQPGNDFVVSLKCGLKIRDIGTVFLVDEQRDSVIVNVSQGVVAVSDSNTVMNAQKNESIIYLPGQRKMYKREIARSFTFRGTTLQQLADELSNEYEIAIVISDENIKDTRISITTRDITLTDFLEIVEQTLGISYRRSEDKITFYNVLHGEK